MAAFAVHALITIMGIPPGIAILSDICSLLSV